MGMVITKVTNDGDPKKVVREIAARNEIILSPYIAKDRFEIHNVPADFTPCFVSEDRLETIYERGGHCVQATDENRERYRFTTREVDGKGENAKFIRGGLFFCLIPKEITAAENDGIVLETYRRMGSGEAFDGFTRSAEAMARMDHPSRSSKFFDEIVKQRAETERTLKQRLAAAREDDAPKNNGKRRTSRSTNDVLAGQGKSRADLFPQGAA